MRVISVPHDAGRCKTAASCVDHCRTLLPGSPTYCSLQLANAAYGAGIRTIVTWRPREDDCGSWIRSHWRANRLSKIGLLSALPIIVTVAAVGRRHLDH